MYFFLFEIPQFIFKIIFTTDFACFRRINFNTTSLIEGLLGRLLVFSSNSNHWLMILNDLSTGYPNWYFHVILKLKPCGSPFNSIVSEWRIYILLSFTFIKVWLQLKVENTKIMKWKAFTNTERCFISVEKSSKNRDRIKFNLFFIVKAQIVYYLKKLHQRAFKIAN